MRTRGWWLFGIAGVLVVAVLVPAGGEPRVPVGGQGPSASENPVTGASEAMAAPVVICEGYLLAGVSKALAKAIASAQDTRGPAFAIAIDGGQAEPLAVSLSRLRDYQNIYYRVIGQAGAWRLEERGFSATGADDESKLIRRALAVPQDRKVYFLPGRQHMLIPAKSSVVLSAGAERWDSRVPVTPGKLGVALRAVILAAGQAVPLDLDGALSTASARAGVLVVLSVARDIMAEGLVAITRGTPVEARVVEVNPPDAVGNPGTLVLELGVAKAVDGSDVPLSGLHGRRLACEGIPGVLCFIRARHLELPSGTRILARASSRVAILAPVPKELGVAGAGLVMGRVTQTP